MYVPLTKQIHAETLHVELPV